MPETTPLTSAHPEEEHGRVAGSAPTLDVEKRGQERRYQGIGVSPGVAIGPAYRFTRERYDVSREEVNESRVEAELARFERAVDRSHRDLEKIASIAREKLGEESAAVFDAQMLMLDDDAIFDDVKRVIRRERCNAEYAVKHVLDGLCTRLEASGSLYLRERTSDLLDVQERLLRHLYQGEILSRIDTEAIVVAKNLSAADMVLFSRREVLGCAMDYGGETSHVSIMARGLGVPAVVSLGGASGEIEPQEEVILDGFRGLLIVNPTRATRAEYRLLRLRYRNLLKEQQQIIPLAATMKSGEAVTLRANLELIEELHLLEQFQAEGVGLFRTEMQFIVHGRLDLPEDELYRTYRSIVEGVAPERTVFRVLDLGGDKMLPMAHREHNPFLGWRGIRILLDRPEVLRLQLRAILRAGQHGPIALLLPMVTHIDELRQFHHHLGEVREALADEGCTIPDDLPVGVMVEVPATALMADLFAKEADFLSIGTNDLTQYVLAVDRDNDLVASKYHDLHPAVLRLIQQTVQAAARAGIPVSVCGQLASNPRATPVLLGLGLRELSASPAYLPEVKRVVRALTKDEAERLAEEALRMPDATSIEEMLDQWLAEHACGFIQLFREQVRGGPPGDGVDS